MLASCTERVADSLKQDTILKYMSRDPPSDMSNDKMSEKRHLK
jgi:hypothetical protein